MIFDEAIAIYSMTPMVLHLREVVKTCKPLAIFPSFV